MAASSAGTPFNQYDTSPMAASSAGTPFYQYDTPPMAASSAGTPIYQYDTSPMAASSAGTPFYHTYITSFCAPFMGNILYIYICFLQSTLYIIVSVTNIMYEFYLSNLQWSQFLFKRLIVFS